MKTNASKIKPNGKISAEALLARAATAKKFADFARHRLKTIKAEHKQARKAFKQAKKVAKRARKDAKIAAKELETKAVKAAKSAKTNSVAAKAGKAPAKARAVTSRRVLTPLPAAALPVSLLPAG